MNYYRSQTRTPARVVQHQTPPVSASRKGWFDQQDIDSHAIGDQFIGLHKHYTFLIFAKNGNVKSLIHILQHIYDEFSLAVDNLATERKYTHTQFVLETYPDCNIVSLSLCFSDSIQLILQPRLQYKSCSSNKNR